MDLPTVVTLLLGGGGIAFVRELLKGVGSLRTGARAEERKAIADLGEQRDQADERAKWAEKDRDYWCRISARYAAQLIRAGIEPDPPETNPPSDLRPRA